MNQNKQFFQNAERPEIKPMHTHKRHLRAALFLAHENRSSVRAFGRILNNFLTTMSLPQKSLAFSVLAVVTLVITAGAFGPSASSVASAQAQNTITRAFAHFVDLSKEERTTLKEKFQDRIHVKGEGNKYFMAMKDLSLDEVEAMHEQKKVSLEETLLEAQAAFDLQVISADKMPMPGFIGKAGRALGFKMNKGYEKSEEKFASLPEDVRQKIQEHMTLREDMKPASFLVYTNAEGQTVYLGMSASDEPVTKFIQSEDGTRPFPHGRKFHFWGSKVESKTE